MLKSITKAIVVSILFGAVLFTGSVSSQTQQIKVEVSPTIGNSINGHLQLKREKYITLSANVDEVKSKLDQTKIDRYFKGIGVELGRKLGMVCWEQKYGKSIRQDSKRPGYIDLGYLISNLKPNDNGLDELKQIFGSSAGLSLHDGKQKHSDNSYPSFMPMYTLDNGHSYFPSNADSHAELAAYLMRYLFTDFQRPQYYELINEPGWQYMGDQRFFQYHTVTKRKFDALNLSTEVGGPCSSVGYYYKKNFESMKEFTGFIDGTNCELDFYSFHLYDFLQWDAKKEDFTGTVSSGLPTEGVFDALSAHTYNTHGKTFTYVGSEHGGYLYNDKKNVISDDLAAQLIGSGSGFWWEMKRRSVDEFIMVNSAIANTLTFMNNPHVVKKAIPFIGLETSSWDPYYYASLLVKENFDKNSTTLHEAQHINFYKFFQGVQGRRVKSICNDNDIQHLSFVDGNALFMLFHNQSNDKGEIDIDVKNLGFSTTVSKIRRVGRGSDFRGYLKEETLSSLSNIPIAGQESCLVILKYNKVIPNSQTLDTRPFYSSESGVKFTGRKDFSVKLADNMQVDHAILRVGIGRKATTDAAKVVNIYLNGTKLSAPVENCADRLTDYAIKSDGTVNTNHCSYATTRIIPIDPWLLEKENKVTVEFADGGEGGVGAVTIRTAVHTNSSSNKSASIDEVVESEPKSLVVYPNPAVKEVSCKCNNAGQLEVFGMNGKLMLTKLLNAGENRITIETLPSGVYLFKLKDGGERASQKVIVK